MTAPTTTIPETIEVELDSRQRLPMARIIQGSQHRFRVERLHSGEYLVTPVVSISERELAVMKDAERMASLRNGLDQAAAGRVTHHEAGEFARLAAELGDDED